MISVVLLMAGSGSRMKYDTNKILLPLGGKKVYEYSLDLFKNMGYEVICVIRDIDKDEIVPFLPNGVKYTFGGKTRQESVLNGLKMATGDYVLVHDAARPLIALEVIKEIDRLHNQNEAILVCSPVKNTIKEKNGDKLLTLDRSMLISAETPQCAPKAILLSAYLKALANNFTATDDISLIERYYENMPIRLVTGNDNNFKITTQIDYKLAKIIVGDNND